MATFIVMSLLIVVQVVVGLRIGYKENVADFLPQSEEGGRYMSVYEELGGQGTITAIFDSEMDDMDDGHYAIIEAVEVFEEVCDSLAAVEGETIGMRCHVDETVALEAMDYIREHTALFLKEEDYRRIDSLLEIEGYVDTCLNGVRRMMAFPMGQVAMSAVSSDPLNLFSPSLQRLESLGPSDNFVIDEDVLFDTMGRGYAFVDSPYGGSDTKGNARIDKILKRAVEVTLQQVEWVKVTCVGAPIIAVGNASQIKRDSLTAMVISLVLIAIILFVSLRKKRHILLLGLSVLVGWLFALSAISLLSTTVSIIVIGIGSVLVGIAVNYPLHFLEHFEGHPDRRETLKEMVEPLVTGNITTVSAFACLIFMDSDAMRDLGMFGALMLVGTILFVMIFLPLMVREGERRDGKEKEVREGQPKTDNEGRRGQPTWVRVSMLGVVVGLTIWLGIRSVNPSFDSDLHNINYMSEEQQRGLEVLNGLLGDSTQTVEYVVSTGASLDEAIEEQEELWSAEEGEEYGGDVVSSGAVKGLVGIVPSKKSQKRSIEAWNAFVARHPGLVEEIKKKAERYGFSDEAFMPFFEIMQSDYEVVEPSEMEPLTAMATSYMLTDESGEVKLVTMVNVPKGESEKYKALLREKVDGTNARAQEADEGENTMFVFDIDDVGNNLVKSLNLDFNYILYVCGFVVFFFLWLSYGRLELALLSFLPLAVAWLWILGIMDIAGVKFNIVNIILATFIFGQGDDYTIFITEGLIYENAYGRKRLKSYRRSVIVSALLMFVGIGSLIVAKHPAMKSLAEVAIIGMAVVVVMACYLPPLVFRWLVEKKGEKRDVPLTLSRIGRTIWVLFVFVFFVFFIITPYTLIYRLIGKDSDKKRLRFHAMIQKLLGIAVRHIPRVKFHYDNSIGETFDRPAVIVANHQSHLDLLCMLQMTPKIVILTNDWVWRNPIYGAIIRYAEFYPVKDGYEALLPKLRSLVDRGYSIVVFPEGTRSEDGEIGRYHKGAFLLAQQLKVDLMPVVIHGATHVMPKRDLVLREGQLTVEVKERVRYDSFADKDTLLLTKEMRALMKAQLEEIRIRIEDERYWMPFVQSQYIYKGREVARRAKRNLREYFATGRADAGQGEVALLKALSHKGWMECEFENEEYEMVARTIAERLKIDGMLKEPSEKADVVVIGGGLGGLLTGAILAKNGRKVTVVEQNRRVGGGLQMFRRGDVEYATGMHVFGGFVDGGVMDKICSYLGIRDKVGIENTDADCIDEIFLSDGQRIRLPRGRENYERYLTTLFPQEAEGIKEYVRAIYELAETEMKMWETGTSPAAGVSNPQYLWSADQLVAYYVKDQKLRALLSYLAPLYAGVAGETPAYVHAMVNVLHIEGSSMFADGSQHFADELASIITKANGRIITGKEVVGVEVNERRAVAVITADGERIEGEQVVSDIDPRQLVRMVTPGAFPSSFRERVNEAPYSYSAFKLFLRLKKDSVPHLSHPRYFFNDKEDSGLWDADNVAIKDWPRCAMAVTSGERQEGGKGATAKTMTVVAPMAYEWFETWEESHVGHRPAEYYEFKKQLEEQLLALLKREMPELEGNVEEMFSSTPLTIRDYNGIHRGSMYGFHKDCNHIMYTQLSVNTKVRNLYLTGQSVNLHGMCGVAITSVMTAESILGKGEVMSRL